MHPAVLDYRIYVLSKTGHFVGVYEVFAESDHAAVEVASSMKPPHGAEIWQRARRVAMVEARAEHA